VTGFGGGGKYSASPQALPKLPVNIATNASACDDFFMAYPLYRFQSFLVFRFAHQIMM